MINDEEIPERLTDSESGEDPFDDVAQVEDADIAVGSYVVVKYCM